MTFKIVCGVGGGPGRESEVELRGNVPLKVLAAISKALSELPPDHTVTLLAK